MQENDSSELDPQWFTYQKLLRNLPEKQLSAWMQVGKKDINALKAWIKLNEQINKNE